MGTELLVCVRVRVLYCTAQCSTRVVVAQCWMAQRSKHVWKSARTLRYVALCSVHFTLVQCSTVQFMSVRFGSARQMHIVGFENECWPRAPLALSSPLSVVRASTERLSGTRSAAQRGVRRPAAGAGPSSQAGAAHLRDTGPRRVTPRWPLECSRAEDARSRPDCARDLSDELLAQVARARPLERRAPPVSLHCRASRGLCHA